MIKRILLICLLIGILAFCGQSADPYFPAIDSQGQLNIDWSGLSITDSIFATWMTKFQNNYDDTDALLGLTLNVNGNLITNFAPLLKLIIYNKMTTLSITAIQQVNKITRLDQFTFLRTMNLNTFKIDLANNSLSDVIFLTPALTLTNLQNIYIGLDGNKVSDSTPFKQFTAMTALQNLELRLEKNQISNWDSLTNLYTLAYLNKIVLYVDFYQTYSNYTFVSNYNNAPALSYFETVIVTCNLVGNYLFFNVSDVTTYQCLPCYDICSKCFGSAYNQCLKCYDDSKFTYNPTTHTCDYKVPQPVDGYLTLNFEKSGIDDYIFTLFMSQFQRSYTTDQITGLDLDLIKNNVTNLTTISKLGPYSNIQNLTIRFDSQSPQIQSIDSQWDFTSGMTLQQLYITMQSNNIANLSFLSPIFKVQQQIVDLELDFGGNIIQDISALSLLNTVQGIQYLTITLTGPISEFDSLSSIGQLQNLQTLYIYFVESNSSIPITFNWVSNLNMLLQLSEVDIYSPDAFNCQLNNNQYIQLSSDGKSISCQQCYLYCKKCYGPDNNQCLSCLGSKFIYNPTNHTCDLQLPPIQSGGIVIIDFDSLLITTPVLISLMAQFKTTYPVNAINELQMDFRYNTIDNYDSFDILSEYQNISLMNMDLGSQEQSTFSMNYNFSKNYNYIMNLSDYTLDGRECKMSNNYITVLRGGLDWACSPCGYQCAKCFGPEINNCLSCVDSYRLAYDPVNHTCNFIFPDIDDGLLIIDICKLQITNDQLPTYMSQLIMYYSTQLHTVFRLVFLSVCGSQISDYSPLSGLNNFGHVGMLELQLYSPTKQINYTFLNQYNYLTNMTYFEEGFQSCTMDHTFIDVSADTYSWSCDPCYTHCSRCFGSSSNQCLACDSSCTYQEDTHSCSCKGEEEKQFVEIKLKQKL